MMINVVEVMKVVVSGEIGREDGRSKVLVNGIYKSVGYIYNNININCGFDCYDITCRYCHI